MSSEQTTSEGRVHFHMMSVPFNQGGDAINQGWQVPLCSVRRYVLFFFFNEQKFPSPFHAQAGPLEEGGGEPLFLSQWALGKCLPMQDSQKLGILASFHYLGGSAVRPAPQVFLWLLIGWDPRSGACLPLDLLQPFLLACKDATVKRGISDNILHWQQMASIFRGPSEEGLMPFRTWHRPRK